jgi:hypothetical protein
VEFRDPFPWGEYRDDIVPAWSGGRGYRWWTYCPRCVICHRLIDADVERCSAHADPDEYPEPWPSEIM